MKKNIFVTQPFLPPLEEFIPYLERIWDSKWLTNAGPFHQQLETELANYLGVEHISLFTNGTIALVTALQALRITGEVITTPYSFVATAHSLLWNNIKPVFVDIDPETFNIDPDCIESAISAETSAIMAVHVYGGPCDVQRIQEIADKNNLKVIYDAAHAFGVKHRGGTILKHGDLSVLSFHATKVFNTFEGGAIISPDAETKKQIDYLKNFGFANEVTVVEAGINGKMDEVSAAFGLLQLKYIDEVIEKRCAIDNFYRNSLNDVAGIQTMHLAEEVRHNYSYFPVLVKPEYPLSRDELYLKLRGKGIYARRYFYPLISDFPMYKDLSSSSGDTLPIASRIAREVLCLPIFPDLELDQAKIIARIICES